MVQALESSETQTLNGSACPRSPANEKGRLESRPVRFRDDGGPQKSMPPIPPIPPPPPPIGIAGFSLGTSATIASVVMSRPATDAASCSAVRTTLVGSMMPLATRFSRCEPHAVDPHEEPPKQHVADRHLVDDGIEPIDKQQLEVGRIASHRNPNARPNLGLCHNCRERMRCLLERLRRSRTEAADANIGVMREVLPSRLADSGCGR